MNKIFKFFLVVLSFVWLGTGCVGIPVTGGWNSHTTVVHEYIGQSPRVVYVRPVPGPPDVMVINRHTVWSGGRDHCRPVPTHEKIVIEWRGGPARVVEGRAYYNAQVE